MTVILSGSFTNTASTPYFLPVQGHVSYLRLTNASKLASYTSARVTNAEWWDYMGNGVAFVDAPTTITGPLNASAVIRTKLAQNGVTVFDGKTYTPGANKTINSFVPGTTTVFTCSGAHGFLVGDVVRIGNMTSAPELGGLLMTVTAVGGGGTTFTTLLNSSNSLTSVGTVYKAWSAGMPAPSLYYPQYRAIAAVSQANPMVVTTLVQQNYQVGDVVTFNIPQGPSSSGTNGYGMSQLNAGTNGLPFQATVSAVNNAVGTQTVTFANVDSSAFTAFAYPGTGFYPIGLPVMIPQGEGNLNNLTGITPSPLPYANQNILAFARQNLGQSGLIIGAGDGTAASSTGSIIGSTADTWYWEVHSSLQQWPAV